ncbi:hypothetical protein [Lysobacter capsici]|uniref:hypothetical protein n=1 Tax=Lysobacter capsici TaxID=435897 RepID=UPI00128FF477|nr:hypothetical protein [Lysobacter capsici]
MKAAIWVQDSVRALPRYLLVLAAVSALALLARAAAPSASRASALSLSVSPTSVSPISVSAPSDASASASPAFVSGVSVAPASAAGVAASAPRALLSPADVAASAPHVLLAPVDVATAASSTARASTASRAAGYPHEHDALIAALSQRASSIPGNSGAFRQDEVSPSAAARFKVGTGDPRAAATTR